MKNVLLCFLIFLFVLLTGTNQSAQIKCIYCADKLTPEALSIINNAVRQAAKKYRDTIYTKLSRINAKEEVLISSLDSFKPDTVIKREYYKLLTGEWFYDWYYVNGYYVKLVTTKL